MPGRFAGTGDRWARASCAQGWGALWDSKELQLAIHSAAAPDAVIEKLRRAYPYVGSQAESDDLLALAVRL